MRERCSHSFETETQKILILPRFRFPLTLCLIRDINQAVELEFANFFALVEKIVGAFFRAFAAFAGYKFSAPSTGLSRRFFFFFFFCFLAGGADDLLFWPTESGLVGAGVKKGARVGAARIPSAGVGRSWIRSLHSAVSGVIMRNGGRGHF